MAEEIDFFSRIVDRIGKAPEEEAFIRAALDNPDDEKPLQNYGDWLQKRGDPRGEYLALCQYGKATHKQPSPRRLELREEIDPLWTAIILREPIPGRVTRITDRAFYVDIGGLEGEAHMSDMSR